MSSTFESKDNPIKVVKDCDSCKHSSEEMDRDGWWRLYCFKKWNDEDGSLVSPCGYCDKFESK